MDQILESAPGWGPLVLSDLDVPHLRALLQIVGGHPHLLLLHDAVEVGFTAVDKDERVRFAIVPWEVQLLETRHLVVVMFPGAGRGARGQRRCAVGFQALDRQRVGLGRGL